MPPRHRAQNENCSLLLLSATDRRVDLLRDGFDFVLRVGNLDDSGLLAKRLGTLPMVNCVSPSYLSKYGVPRVLADLDSHLLVNYSIRLGSSASFEYREAGRYLQRPMRSLLTVNNTDAYRAACLAGLGIIQAPRLGLGAALARPFVDKPAQQLACSTQARWHFSRGRQRGDRMTHLCVRF